MGAYLALILVGAGLFLKKLIKKAIFYDDFLVGV